MPRTGHSLPSLRRLLLNNNQLRGSFRVIPGSGGTREMAAAPGSPSRGGGGRRGDMRIDPRLLGTDLRICLESN